MALNSLTGKLALVTLLRSQAGAAGAAITAELRAAARNPANQTCKLTLRGRTVPVACGLQRSIQQATGHNNALAALLALMISRSR
jgi:hypothetical protein